MLVFLRENRHELKASGLGITEIMGFLCAESWKAGFGGIIDDLQMVKKFTDESDPWLVEKQNCT